MKSLILRSSVALACALSLAACGGSDGNLLLGGRISGLTKDGLVLQNKGGTALAIAAGQSLFSFPELIGNDQEFDVTIKSAPSNAVCTIANGKGTSGSFNVTSIQVTCITNTYDLGGTITGANPGGLVLVNGADRVEVKAGETSFKLNKVADGAPYGVTVLTQPAGRTCTVLNGVGTMGSAPVNSIQVQCA